MKGLKQQLGDADAHNLLSKAVYLFSIGGNDYNTIPNNTKATTSFRKMYMSMVLGNFTAGIKVHDQALLTQFHFLNLNRIWELKGSYFYG